MSLKNDSFPSSAAFDQIAAAFSDDGERAEAIKKGNAIFGFTLKNSQGETADWHIDLKETGKVGTGKAPEGGKSDVTLVLSDSDFGKLTTGQANAQSLFMSGKLKIRGNVMKATKMEPILKSVQNKAKL